MPPRKSVTPATKAATATTATKRATSRSRAQHVEESEAEDEGDDTTDEPAPTKKKPATRRSSSRARSSSKPRSPKDEEEEEEVDVQPKRRGRPRSINRAEPEEQKSPKKKAAAKPATPRRATRSSSRARKASDDEEEEEEAPAAPAKKVPTKPRRSSSRARSASRTRDGADDEETQPVKKPVRRTKKAVAQEEQVEEEEEEQEEEKKPKKAPAAKRLTKKQQEEADAAAAAAKAKPVRRQSRTRSSTKATATVEDDSEEDEAPKKPVTATAQKKTPASPAKPPAQQQQQQQQQRTSKAQRVVATSASGEDEDEEKSSEAEDSRPVMFREKRELVVFKPFDIIPLFLTFIFPCIAAGFTAWHTEPRFLEFICWLCPVLAQFKHVEISTFSLVAHNFVFYLVTIYCLSFKLRNATANPSVVGRITDMLYRAFVMIPLLIAFLFVWNKGQNTYQQLLPVMINLLSFTLVQVLFTYQTATFALYAEQIFVGALSYFFIFHCASRYTDIAIDNVDAYAHSPSWYTFLREAPHAFLITMMAYVALNILLSIGYVGVLSTNNKTTWAFIVTSTSHLLIWAHLSLCVLGPIIVFFKLILAQQEVLDNRQALLARAAAVFTSVVLNYLNYADSVSTSYLVQKD